MALTQSAETCLGDIGAAVGLASLLPLEITGHEEREVASPVEVRVQTLRHVSLVDSSYC